MTKTPLIVTLEQLVLPIIHSQGLVLWGMELLQSGRPVLRIFVDVPPRINGTDTNEAQTNETHTNEAHTETSAVGADTPPPATHDTLDVKTSTSAHSTSASIDQCARVSRMLGLALEVENVFSSAYVLEVSSPGLSRPFFHVEQLQGFVGDTLEIVLTETLTHGPESLHGRKKFSGVVLSVNVAEGSFCVRLSDAKGEEHELELMWHMVRKATRVHMFVVPEKPGKRKKGA